MPFVVHEAPKVDLSGRHMGARYGYVVIDHKLWAASLDLQPLENHDLDVRLRGVRLSYATACDNLDRHAEALARLLLLHDTLPLAPSQSSSNTVNDAASYK